MHKLVFHFQYCRFPAYLIVSLILLTACSSPSSLKTQGLMENRMFAGTLPKPEVTLGPGDELDVQFRYWPELDTSQTIRPDGKITLQLVGHVQVAGLTPEKLDSKLVEVYRDKILDPEVATIVRSLANQKVYVGGEVLNPGLIELQTQMSVLEAIMAAGGFNKLSAELSNVVIVRHASGQRFATTIDLEEALQGREVLYLAPRDIVYVPRTRIDSVNQWIDQHINKVIPHAVFDYSIIGSDSVLTIGGGS